MRQRMIPLVAGTAVLVSVLAVWVLVQTGSEQRDPAVLGTEPVTIQAGEVELAIRPHHIDDTGAAFAITLDTHSVELTMDLEAATLQVDGVTWPTRGWEGDGPDGHHRTGLLSFTAVGRTQGPVRLLLPDFDERIEATWELPS